MAAAEDKQVHTPSGPIPDDVLATLVETSKVTEIEPPSNIDSRLLDEAVKDRQADRTMRIDFGWAIFGLLAAQLAFVNYLLYRMVDRLSDGVIYAVIGSMLVEVLGLGYVVANYLFPNGQNRGRDKAKSEPRTPR